MKDLLHGMVAARGLTFANAWHMRSLARRDKRGTLGSVFITASYLLTASSYLEREAGGCFVNECSMGYRKDTKHTQV